MVSFTYRSNDLASTYIAYVAGTVNSIGGFEAVSVRDSLRSFIMGFCRIVMWIIVVIKKLKDCEAFCVVVDG